MRFFKSIYMFDIQMYISILFLLCVSTCIYNHRTTKTNQKYPSVNL